METNNIINSNFNINVNSNINGNNNNNNNIIINNNNENNKITNQNILTNNNNNNNNNINNKNNNIYNNINTNNITNNNISTFDDSTISIKMNEIKLKPSSSDSEQNIFSSNINSNQNNTNKQKTTDLLETINEETTKYIEDMKKGTYNILVAVRCRPLSNKEKEFSLTETINILERKVIILKDPNALINNPNNTRSKEQTMAFDFAFNKNENQFEIFNNTTKFLIDGVVNGFNATVFAYGATGAGKTYTMLGTEENPGIMPLTLKELFNKIKSYPEREYTVKLWYLEIYNENIRDLLNNNSDEYLDLREDPNKGIIVSGITEITTKSSEHILSILKKGNKNRTTEATNANETSSRSHAILQILVSYKEKTSSAIEYEIKYGKLSLIDLAGSERASVTQNQGIRLFEGANINRSLLTLGNCIKALCESAQKGKQIYVPYRDSKLTRLLKDSLGGNSRTVMIANISPSVKAYDDTYNTLNFANKAKNIKTSIKRNVLNAQYHISNYVNIIKNLQSRIFELEGQVYRKRDLTASPKQRKRQGTPGSSNKRNYNNNINNNINNNNNNNSIGDGSGRIIENNAINNNNKFFENLVNEIKNLCDNELKLKQKVITQQIDIYNKINQIKKDENNNIIDSNNNNENEEEKKKIKEQKKIWEKNLINLKEISNSIKNFLDKNLSNSLLSNIQKDYLSMIVKNNKNKISNFDIKFKLILLKNQSEDKNNYINLLEKQILLRDNILLENKITQEDFSKETKEKYKTIQQIHNEFNNNNNNNTFNIINNNFNNNNNYNNNISQPFSSKNVHSGILSNPNSNNNNGLNRSTSNKDCTDKNNNNNNNVHLPPLSGNNSGINTLTNLNSVLSDIKELNVKINNISNISKNQNNSYIKDNNNNLQFQNIQINNNRPNTQQNNIINNLNNINNKRGGNDRLQKIRRYSNNIRNINTNNNNNINYNHINTNNYINTPLKYNNNNNNNNNKNKNFFTRNNLINNNIPGSAKHNNRIFKGNNNITNNNNYNNINNLTDNSLRKLNGIRNNLYNEYNSYTIDYFEPSNNNNNNININNYLPNDMKISEEIETSSMKNDFSQSLNNNNNHNHSHNNILNNNNNNQTYNLKLKNNLSHSSSNNSMKGLSYLNHSRSQSKEYSKRKNDNNINNNNIRIKEMSPYRMQNKRKIPFKI